MAANTVGDFIKSVFPTLVNKSGSVFQALFANPNEDGTVETIFNELEAERKVWESDGSSIYNQTGEQLEKTLGLFSVLKRINSDTDETLLNRLRLLFYRNGDTVWGDKWNILKLFKVFFGTDKVWIVNNTESFENNLLENGNFENTTGWTLDNCTYDTEARFEETRGILFNASGTCLQRVTVAASKVHFLHFFLKGNIRVQIIDNNGRYWNPTGGDIGSWSTSEYYNSFSTATWDNKNIFFITDESVSAVTIKFVYAPGYYGFIDYVMLNAKTKASTFSLIVVFEGTITDETVGLAPGTNDPITAYDNDKMGYFSPGGTDAQKKALDSMSYFDQSPITDNVHPVMAEGTDDVEPKTGYDNMTYLGDENNDGTTVLAPESMTGTDGQKTVNYEKVSYFDKSFLFGGSGGNQTDLYSEILDIVQPGGVTSFIELLTRESDENQ